MTDGQDHSSVNGKNPVGIRHFLGYCMASGSWIVLLQFLASAATIFFSASVLTAYFDQSKAVSKNEASDQFEITSTAPDDSFAKQKQRLLKVNIELDNES